MFRPLAGGLRTAQSEKVQFDSGAQTAHF